MTLLDDVLRATEAANRRADEAEARCRNLEALLVSQTARTDRAEVEAQALYQMLPEEVRPTT